MGRHERIQNSMALRVPRSHAYRDPRPEVTASTIAAYAREHSMDALKVLIEIMNDYEVAPEHRMRAANHLLDRGIGKPRQTVEIEGDVNVNHVHVDSGMRGLYDALLKERGVNGETIDGEVLKTEG